ncbi:MAG: hypothetical protein ACPGVG_02510 [Mycobacterium sp.]
MTQSINTKIPKTGARRLLTNNSTASSFPAITDSDAAYTAVDESGDPSGNYAVIDPSDYAVVSMQFFGTDAANETFNVLVLGVKKFDGSDDHTYDVVANLSVTLGAATGRDGSTVEDENFYADTIVANKAVGGSDTISPADDRKATFRFNNDGYEQIIVLFDLTGAASANGLYWLS